MSLPTISPSDNSYLSALSIIMVAFGGLYAVYQWSKTIKIRRAEFIKQVIAKFWFDKDMANTVYKLENISSDFEYEVDKLFYYLSFICYLRQTKNINEKEFCMLRYVVIIVCQSDHTQHYLWDFYHFSTRKDIKKPFDYLIEFGIKSNNFPADFYKSNCSKYVHLKLPLKTKRLLEKETQNEIYKRYEDAFN